MHEWITPPLFPAARIRSLGRDTSTVPRLSWTASKEIINLQSGTPQILNWHLISLIYISQ
eukprot:COSAG02_NODE_7308_length_3072_cov_2.627985_5_plen_59_part_01